MAEAEVCLPWPLAPWCLPDGWSADPTQWTTDQRMAVEAAYELLSKLVAGAYGLCAVKVRPCRYKACADKLPDGLWPIGSSPWVPVMLDGRAYNITCGCTATCGCGPICEIKLDGPVYDIIQIKIDGQVIDPNTYWVDNNNILVRRQDTGCWPECQQLDLPDTEPGTWSVTYRRGSIPGIDGQIALAMLAAEIYKSCHGNRQCVLSERVTRVVREGVEIELDTIEEIRQGSTGIPFVDRWVALVNPYGARLPMRAWSPDLKRPRRQTSGVGLVPGPGPGPGPWPDPNQPVNLAYEYHQVTAAATWLIVHNLGFRPAGVQLIDDSGREIAAEVTYPNANTVRLDFNAPYAGVAYLS